MGKAPWVKLAFMISLKCRLDIRLGSQTLHDELVWDVNSTEHDPDSFAAVLCKDLSADKAFVPLVAWHIRQQVDTKLMSVTTPSGIPQVHATLLSTV